MVWLPAWIKLSPCAPIRNPPMTRPISPGRPRRCKMIGPSRITAKTRRNVKTGPDVALSLSSSHMSVLCADQGHVLLGLPEPARDQLVDRPVGLQAMDRRVDDLAVG